MPKKKNETPVSRTYLYISDGAFINGVPTRDIPESEWLTLPVEATAAALFNDLYQLTDDVPPADPVADEPDSVTDDQSSIQPAAL